MCAPFTLLEPFNVCSVHTLRVFYCVLRSHLAWLKISTCYVASTSKAVYLIQVIYTVTALSLYSQQPQIYFFGFGKPLSKSIQLNSLGIVYVPEVENLSTSDFPVEPPVISENWNSYFSVIESMFIYWIGNQD